MFQRAALIHYHEIGLKGRNRADFERRLADNVSASIAGPDGVRVERFASRLLVRTQEPTDIDSVVEVVRHIPGVASVAPTFVTDRDISQIMSAAKLALGEAIERIPEPRSSSSPTFAVESRRSSTNFEMSSMEMNRVIGQHLVDEFGLSVNLGDPDITVRVEVVQGDAYVSSAKIPGPGGLPVGSSGKVISLLSAGIDSPVASWRMARRGAVVVGIHFSGRPQTNDLSELLVHDIGLHLQRCGGIGRIYFVPFGDLQKEISLSAPPDLRILLYRRLMIRVAEAIAGVERAKALVTGESLGQVASQTLDNIAAVDDAARLPVLRPLIGSDKLEIIAEARSLGTYGLSTQDHTDCCTLFMPRNPETHASISQVIAGEASLDIEAMVSQALSLAVFRDYACPAYRPPRHMPPEMSQVQKVT